MDYTYPIDPDWSTEEIIHVVQFFEAVEKAYEQGVSREELMEKYRLFKTVVPSKSEEKKVCGTFEKASGYSPYRAVTKAKDAQSDTMIKI